MGPIVDLLIPVVLVLLMFVVGLGLTGSDFQRLRDQKRVVVLATLGQIVLLPVLAVGLARVFDPRPHIAIGLVLVAACPGGALSNYYSHLARANVALSVTLTSVASLASLVTLPIGASIGLALLTRTEARVVVPVGRVLLQLLCFVLLPIAIGMLARARWPSRMARCLPALSWIGLLVLLGLLAVVVVDQAGALAGEVPSVIGLAISFTVVSFGLGAGLGRMLRLGRPEISSLGLEFSVRNLAIMALVAVTVFGRPEYVLFGAVFLVVQTPTVLLATYYLRRGRGGRESARREAASE